MPRKLGFGSISHLPFLLGGLLLYTPRALEETVLLESRPGQERDMGLHSLWCHPNRSAGFRQRFV